MGYKVERKNIFLRNIVRIEALLSKSYANFHGSNFVFADAVYEKKIQFLSDYEMFVLLNNSDNLEHNIIAETEDRKGAYQFVHVSKILPKSIRNRYRVIPSKAIYVSTFLVSETGLIKDKLNFAFVYDKSGKIIILDADKRFNKRDKLLSKESVDELNYLINVYLSVSYATYLSDYIISYKFNDSTIYFPLVGEDVKDLLKDRDKEGDRRKPICYGVDEYVTKKGKSVISHMRGTSSVQIKGRKMMLLVSANKWTNYTKEVEIMKLVNNQGRE